MKNDRKFQKFKLEVGLKVRQAREDMGLTQEDMLFEGFERRYYQRIEAGEINLTLQTLYKLSVIFKVNVRELL